MLRYRLTRAEHDLSFFASYYFPHYMQSRSSEFHWYLYHELKRIVESELGQRVAIAAPRGNAKSSIVSLIFILWCIVFRKKHFIVLLSDTSSQAEEFLANIRNEIESNERLIKDFGSLVGDSWKADDIITNNQVRVLALGARKKIRGRRFKNKRPDLIVGDDMENDENTVNPDQRRKNENWFFKAVSKAGTTATDIIVIGTIIHYDSLLSKLLSNPVYQARTFKAVKSFSESPLWLEWEEIYLSMSEDEKKLDINPAKRFYLDHEADMLVGADVLWPDGQPYYNLMEMRLTEGPASFDSEYQNNPINPDDCLFQEEWIKYYDTPAWERYTAFYGACDPSMGKTAKSDPSAIIWLGKHEEGYLDIIHASVERRHPDQILNDLLSSASQLITDHPDIPIAALAIESVQFQEYFRDRVSTESRVRGFYLPVVSTDNQTSKKEIRIQTLQPLVKNGVIRFNKQHRLLLEQLRYYPLADHDDGPDALEMAVRKARRPQLASSKYQ